MLTHRHRIQALATVGFLLIGGAAIAEEPSPRELELMTSQLERLFQPLEGAIEARDLRYRRHGGGVYSLTYSLAAGTRSISGSKALAEDKPIRTLNIGHMASEPTNPGSVVTAVVADVETEYNLWWAVVNRGEEEETRKTSVVLSGPEGFRLEVEDDVVYPRRAVSLFWFNPEMPFKATGLYTYRINVRSGSRMFYRFWVEPLTSDEPADE